MPAAEEKSESSGQPALGQYKKGQGTWVRWSCTGVLWFLGVFGAFEMWKYLHPGETWRRALLGPVEVFGRAPYLDRWGAVCIATALLVGAVLWWLMNRPWAADFLIDTESELRKVAWPTQREYVGASVVVISLVVFVALFVYGVDKVLVWILKRLGTGI